MSTLRRYPSRIAAEEAAQALRERGIIATVVGDIDSLCGMGIESSLSQFSIVLLDTDRHDDARRILAEFDAQPSSPEPEWEAGAIAPDLSRLDHSITIPCPHCSAGLPRDSALTACPACRAPVNPVQIILDSHGPDALARCYSETDDSTPDAAVDAAPLHCRACGYPLSGLPQESHCPECGKPYSKRRILRG